MVCCKAEIDCVIFTEAEYYAMTHAFKEALWIWSFLHSLDFPIPRPFPILSDNQAACALSLSPSVSTRSAHIDIRHHFIRSHIQDGSFSQHGYLLVICLPTSLQKPFPFLFFQSIAMFLVFLFLSLWFNFSFFYFYSFRCPFWWGCVAIGMLVRTYIHGHVTHVVLYSPSLRHVYSSVVSSFLDTEEVHLSIDILCIM